MNIKLMAVVATLITLNTSCVGRKMKLENLESKINQLEKTIEAMKDKREEDLNVQKDLSDRIAKLMVKLDDANKPIPSDSKVDMLKKDGQAFREWTGFLSTFAVDYGHYPEMPKITQNGFGYSFCDIALLGPQLFDYGHANPLDPWGSPFLYWRSADGKHYMLVCTGADKKLFFSEKLLKLISTRIQPSELLPQIVSRCLQDDIVYYDNELLQYPEKIVEDCKTN